MPFYVYIIQSQKDGIFYKGSTSDPVQRLIQHNLGKSSYTSAKCPWKLVYVEELPNKREMLVRERKLKRGNATYFGVLISSPANIVNRFLEPPVTVSTT